MTSSPHSCPACNQKNNPAFTNCWKCGASLVEGASGMPVPLKLEPPVVGFWKRLVSDIFDAVILGTIALAAAFPLREFLYPLGEGGWWIGLIVTFFYTGLLQSSFGKGQSLAKKALKIQVVRLDGSYMSLPVSFLRYTVLAGVIYNGVIFMALNSIIPNFQGSYLEKGLFALTLLGVFGCTVLVAFHPLKRGLQDFIAGTVVVPVGRFDRDRIQVLNDSRKAMRACWVWISLTVTVCVSIYFVLPRFFPTDISDLLAISPAVQKDSELRNIGVNLNFAKPENKVSLIVSGFLPKKIFDQPEELRKNQDTAAKTAVRTYKGQVKPDAVFVVVRSGFNLGIANLGITAPVRRYDVEGNPVESDSQSRISTPSPSAG